ncbi:MAG TPA: acetamidase/formamidase family protein [Bryobacteraceae bacterium]|nr:acetamidase/formamidase family protein [Bryobacteraceae bacterium]
MRPQTTLLFLALAACSCVFAQDAPVTHYDLKMQDLKYVYGPSAPVARVPRGGIIETNTVDADGKAVEAAGLKVPGFNPLTGPFYVEGAEPGDTLVVRFLSVEVDGDKGYGDIDPSFGGALNSNHYTPMLGKGVEARSWVYPIDKASKTATFQAKDSNFSVNIPLLHPFLGCVGVAPADGEVRSSIVPAEYGGNMDASEATAGNTLYLPVNVPGALLFMGDGHAAMGDGEIAGTAIEVSTRVRIQVDLLKGKTIHWPRFENNDYLMAVGIYRPLDDALRISFTELIQWIHERNGLSESDAYELLSKVAEIHLAEMVDPNYVVVAKIDKKFLVSATGQ